MSGLTAILALIRVLPKLIDLLVRLGNQIEQNRVDEWLEDVDASIRKLESAKTAEDRRDAAISVGRAFARRKR